MMAAHDIEPGGVVVLRDAIDDHAPDIRSALDVDRTAAHVRTINRSDIRRRPMQSSSPRAHVGQAVRFPALKGSAIGREASRG
jgi:hypothetical protein